MTDFQGTDRAARDKEKWEKTWESWWRTDRVDAKAAISDKTRSAAR